MSTTTGTETAVNPSRQRSNGEWAHHSTTISAPGHPPAAGHRPAETVMMHPTAPQVFYGAAMNPGGSTVSLLGTSPQTVPSGWMYGLPPGPFTTKQRTSRHSRTSSWSEGPELALRGPQYSTIPSSAPHGWNMERRASFKDRMVTGRTSTPPSHVRTNSWSGNEPIPPLVVGGVSPPSVASTTVPQQTLPQQTASSNVVANSAHPLLRDHYNVAREPTQSPRLSPHHARNRSWSGGPLPDVTIPSLNLPPATSNAWMGSGSVPLHQHHLLPQQQPSAATAHSFMDYSDWRMMPHQQHPSAAPPPLPPSLSQKHVDNNKNSNYNNNSSSAGMRIPPQPRRTRERTARRKAHSSSAAVPGNYGAFWGHTTSTERNAPFSPRSEFRQLTNQFRSASPVMGANGRVSPVGGRSMSFSRMPVSLPTTPQIVGTGLPLGTIHSATGRHTGGEAVFLAQQGRRTHHRNESIRKMQIRQQSAQLFVEDIKGEVQSKQCRDVLFLLIFVFHLLFMGYLGKTYGSESWARHTVANETTTPLLEGVYDDDEVIQPILVTSDGVEIYYQNLLYIACLCGLFAVALSALLLSAMTIFTKYFVQVALMIVITLSFIWGTVGIGLSPKTVVPVTGIIALAVTVAYSFIVWDRIPFAAANLLTALSGVQANPGTIVVAFCFQALALGWSVYYAIVVYGVYDSIQDNKLQVSSHNNMLRDMIYGFLAISYYWTFQVLQNSVQVATAAVIGGWWHSPSDQQIVRNACWNTFFYYMGSICFGSLFVGPVRVLRQLSGLVRPTSSENVSLMCVHECMSYIQTCLSSCVDSMANNFNTWGFTYVGLYGYAFMSASQNATKLFERRGWTVIVSDDLVSNILLIASLVVGGVTGCFAHLISQIDQLRVTSQDSPGIIAFVEGFLIGIVLTSVLFAVISSSVNSTIVCFAASPVDFETNHPELSHEMRSAWREVWPGSLDVIDLRMGIPTIPVPMRTGPTEASPLISRIV